MGFLNAVLMAVFPIYIPLLMGETLSIYMYMYINKK